MENEVLPNINMFLIADTNLESLTVSELNA